MPGFNPEKLNIHDLTIEEPEKQSEAFFDIERDIGPETWRNMNDKLASFKVDNDWNRFIQLGMNMKIIDSDIDFSLDELAVHGIEDRLEVQRNQSAKDNNWAGFVLLSLGAKIIDPTINIKIDAPVRQYMRDKLKAYRDVGNWSSFARQAMEMQVFDSKTNIDIDAEAMHGMMHRLESYRKKGDWFAIISFAGNMKILGINMDIRLDDLEAKQGIKNQFEHSKNYGMKHGDWSDLSRFASAMQILAAEKVEVTDKGLEITMPEKKEILHTETPQIPEQKQF